MALHRPKEKGVFLVGFSFAALCSLLLGLICAQSASSSRVSCNLRYQLPCRSDSSICINLSQVRDGQKDCPDGSDEDASPRCSDNEFACKSGKGCISRDRVRDGISDCFDGSDEECPPSMHRCQCGIPKCIEKNLVADGVKHCADGSDEGEDNSNILCADMTQQDLFAIERKKRRRRQIENSKNILQDRSSISAEYSSIRSSDGTQNFDSLISGKIYLTAVNEPKSTLSTSTGTDHNIPFTKRSNEKLQEISYGSDMMGVSGITMAVLTGTKQTEYPTLSIASNSQNSADSEKTAGYSKTTSKIEDKYTVNNFIGDRIDSVNTLSYQNNLQDPSTYSFFSENHPLKSDADILTPSTTTSLPVITDYFSEDYAEIDFRGKNDNNIFSKHDTNFKVPSNGGDVFDKSGREIRDDTHARRSEGSNHEYEDKGNFSPSNKVYFSPSKPTVITRYIQPTNYDSAGKQLSAEKGPSSRIEVNEYSRLQLPTLRGHSIRSRQGRLYNPSSTVAGRRVHHNPGAATVITDQFILPTHPMPSFQKASSAFDSSDLNIDRAYYEVYGLENKNQYLDVEAPKLEYIKYTSSVSDSRITRTVGMYGPIYDTYYDAHAGNADSLQHSRKELLTDEFNKNLNTNDEGETITLFGFAQFSTKISGTNYVFMPAATQPRTFVPKISITKISSQILPNAKSDVTSQPSFDPAKSELLIPQPLFVTDTREFVSQMSMFTSTVKDPIKLQKTMLTSTVITKQLSDTRSRFAKVGDETKVAETLPLNLETIYQPDIDKFSIIAGSQKDILVNIKDINYDNSMKLDVSQIVDDPASVEKTNSDHPTGLVSSIKGTEVTNGVTTHWTTLIFGTYIDNTYAHVIESTSSIFFTISKTASPIEMVVDDTVESTQSSQGLDMSVLSSRDDYHYTDYSDRPILSSLSDISYGDYSESDVPTESLTTDGNLAILTSGFILPTIIGNEKLPVSFRDTDQTESVSKSTAPVDLEVKEIKVKLQVPTPYVIYVDDIESSLITDIPSAKPIETLTDRFIFPGAKSSDHKHEADSDENNIKTQTDSVGESLTSGVYSESRITKLRSKSESVDDDKTANDINENISSIAVPSSPMAYSSLVLLMDDFILPQALSSLEYEKKTETRSLPEKQQHSTIRDNLSILTDGFILPGQNILSSSTTIENMAPSSALLKADTLDRETDLNNQLTARTSGRSAAVGDKKIISDSMIVPTSTKEVLGILDDSEHLENVSTLNETLMIQNMNESNQNDNAQLEDRKVKAIKLDNTKYTSDTVSVISFPVTYFTTSTYFTTFLVNGQTSVASKEETFTHVYTDKEHLQNAGIYTTSTFSSNHEIKPTKSLDSPENHKTLTYHSTVVKDGTTTVSSAIETQILSKSTEPHDEPHPTLIFPTTYYTTLTYFTTLLRSGSSTIVTNENVVSNVVHPTKETIIVPSSTENFHQTLSPDSTDRSNPTTYYTTYTYFTTFHKDGTTSVNTRLQTISNVVSDEPISASSVFSEETELEPASVSPNHQTVLYTTYTYYTTYLRGGNTVISSREQVISNPVSQSFTPVLPTTPLVLETTTTISPLKTTFFTTYTYYTTLLKQGMTTVSTRKETVTNVLHGSPNLNSKSVISTENDSVKITASPVVQTYFTTFTYYTTFLRDGSNIISSRESTATNVVTVLMTPSSSPNSNNRTLETYYTTLTSYYTLYNGAVPSVSTVYSILTDIVAASPSQKFTTQPSISKRIDITPVEKTYLTTYTYYTTLLNGNSAVTSSREETITSIVTVNEIGKSLHSTTVPDTFSSSNPNSQSATSTPTLKNYYTTYTYYTTYVLSGTPSVDTRYETITNYDTERVIHHEPSTGVHHTPSSLKTSSLLENITPSNISPFTYYTTYTYFTTELKDGSNIIHTKTHVVSNTIDELQDVQTASVQVLENSKPSIIKPSTENFEVNTFYTTYTFYTTLFSGNGIPAVTNTRLETVTNLISKSITPTTSSLHSARTDLDEAEGGYHENSIQPSPALTRSATRTYITASLKSNGETQYITRKVSTAVSLEPSHDIIHNVNPSTNEFSNTLLPTPLKPCCDDFHRTVYTTYTYYTTRFHGSQPVINTRYETITNVIKRPIDSTAPTLTDSSIVLGENLNFSTLSLPIPNQNSITLSTRSYRLDEEQISSMFDLYKPSNIVSLTTQSLNIENTVTHKVTPSSNEITEKINILEMPSKPLSNQDKLTNSVILAETSTEHAISDKMDIFESLENTTLALTTDITTIPPTTEDNIRNNNVTLNNFSPAVDKNFTEAIMETTNTTESSPVTPQLTNTAITKELLSETTDLNSGFMETTTAEINDKETTTAEMNDKETTTLEMNVKQTTTEEYVNDITTPVATTRRSIFSRRRTRPVFRPRPTIRSSTQPTTSTQKIPKATTRNTILFSKRNTSTTHDPSGRQRLLFRRPQGLNRTFPIRRLRKPIVSPTTESIEEAPHSKRRRRSFFNSNEKYEFVPLTRKLLSAVDEIYDKKHTLSFKNNDLISPESRSVSTQKDQFPLGLLRSVEAKAVTDGTTTIYATEIHGTFVNGAYAQVVQSKVRIYSDPPNDIKKTILPINATPSFSTTHNEKSENENRVGLVSSIINSSVMDRTTTVYTTNIYGTYVGNVYAHIAQTSSSVIKPTTTSKNVYSTGLISSSTRAEVNADSTTLWTTKIYGTFVNGYYAHIASTFSNIFAPSSKLEVQPTLLPTGFQNHIHAQVPSQVGIFNRGLDSSQNLATSLPDYKIGLLSSFVLDSVDNSGTTTQYTTNVYGTFIGHQYAQHIQTTSRIIAPTNTEQRSIGLVSSLVRSVINDNIATLYRTEVYGTYIGQLYAQIAKTSTEFKIVPTRTRDQEISSHATQKTGLLSSSIIRSEITDGTTTIHLNEIYGTFIGNAYAHIARSTSKIVFQSRETKAPEITSTESKTQNTGLVSSTVKTEVNSGTTTLHITEIHGTYIGNYYAHIARRTSTVLPFVSPTPIPLNEVSKTKTEGLISSEIRTEINYGTTTLHTREIYGTSINGFYAHIARSTSNIVSPTLMKTSNVGLISSVTNSEYNNGFLTLHTTEIYGTSINGYYAHVARSTSNIISTPYIRSLEQPTGVISATTSTVINDGQTTLFETSTVGLTVDGRYVQTIQVTSTVIPSISLYTKPLGEFEPSLLVGPAADDLDTERVNQLDAESHKTRITENHEYIKSINVKSSFDYLLSPSLNTDNVLETNDRSTPSLLYGLSEKDITVMSQSGPPILSLSIPVSSTPKTDDLTSLPVLESSTKQIKDVSQEDKKTTTVLPHDDIEEYNEDIDEDKIKKVKENSSSKISSRAPARNRSSMNKQKPHTSSTLRKIATSNRDYDDYNYDEDDEYDDFDSKISKNLVSSRYAGSRRSQAKHSQSFRNLDKSSSLYKNEYEDFEDDEDIYDDNDSIHPTPTKNARASSSATESETPSSIKIRPFVGRGRPTFGSPIRTTTTRSSFTIQFRRPSRTRNSLGYSQRSDNDNNDFDDDIDEDENDGDIEASEAVVTTATPQALPVRRRQFGNNRYQPPGRTTTSSTTTRPLNLSRNRRLFGRSSSSTSTTQSPKDSKDPDYEENTTEDDDFDEYEDVYDKHDNVERHRNVRFTRRPPSRRTFGERRSASNKRGSFRHREDEEIENDGFDTTTPDYRYSRNRSNQRKSYRNRNNRNRSPSLKASFNSVSRDDEEEDSQSLQPINRIRNNNRNRRPSYNPRSRRPTKSLNEAQQTNYKPHLTVTSVVTTIKTLPIYHGFRTSYATLTTTALDTSIINPSQYSTVVNDGVTKTLFSSRVGYPDGFENLHTTITEVVITTTSLASIKLVPIKIGFSTRTDTITDIQVLTTLSTVYTTIAPDAPTPTAFPQQFQPPYYPQIQTQNQDFGLLTSVATQIVTSTTIVPIILRGRTILSTLTTTSTAQSTVVQTPSIRVPQVPSAAPYIHQPYFAFQPLTTLLTLYVTGEHGELKPVVTTVTVPLYQQPVFHTKVARSLQSSAGEKRVLSTESPNSFLKSSANSDISRDIDIGTHYDKLLSSGLEEINDMSVASKFQTDPLDMRQMTKNFKSTFVYPYDLTTISKGPLTEIYEQKATVTLDSDQQNEILSKNTYDDNYGIGSKFNFRKLHQFIQEDPAEFQKQRDFTRLRRPPPNIIRTSVLGNRQLVRPTNQPFREDSDSTVRLRRPGPEILIDNTDFSSVQGNRFRARGLSRRPPQRPLTDFRPSLERPVDVISEEPIDIPRSIQSNNQETPLEHTAHIASVPDANNNVNEFIGSPLLDNLNDEEFRPITGIASNRNAVPFNEESNFSKSVPVRRLRITRPISRGELTNSGIRRITRTRFVIPSTSAVSPEYLENELLSITDPNHKPQPHIFNEANPVQNNSEPDTNSDLAESGHTESYRLYSSRNSNSLSNGPHFTQRATIRKRLRPSFIPGDGSGARKPVLIRRTRTNSVPLSSLSNIDFGSRVSIQSSAILSPTNIINHSSNSEFTSDTEKDEENKDSSTHNDKPLKKVIRLRRPEGANSLQQGQRRRVVVSRKPPEQEYGTPIQARGPATSSVEHINGNNLVPDYDHTVYRDDNIADFNIIPSTLNSISNTESNLNKAYPFTYYTTLTYFTTFLHGTDTNYASREATFSNIINQTLNPSLITVFKSHLGQISPSSDQQIVQLASRTLGDTTTIVNLASKRNVFNDDVNKLFMKEDNLKTIPASAPQSESVLTTDTPTMNLETDSKFSTVNIENFASLPKTYVTLFTYLYTVYDGSNIRESTRAETITSIISASNPFLSEAAGSTVNSLGLISIGPTSKTVKLGSRKVEGTTTEVNLNLKTLIKLDGVQNVVLERTQAPLSQDVTTRSLLNENLETILPSHTLSSSSSKESFTDSPYFISSSLQPSYSSISELYGFAETSDTSSETSPLLSNIINEESETVFDGKSVIKVTSILHKQAGPLRSGVFTPRPGVRVRVRPVVSRRLASGQVLPSFQIPLNFEDTSNALPIPTSVIETSFLTDYVTDTITDLVGIVHDNELISEDVDDDSTITEEGALSPPRKRLKITVRRPQSESVSRTHTRFVLPSRFEITSRPRFYVVTRTGALGVVSPSQRPFTVKISRKVKPSSSSEEEPILGSSTTVIFETYTTLTTVPVIFGLETSFRNVIVTTSSPITISQPVTPDYETPLIAPTNAVVLTYFTTTTYTIPYLDGDETKFTTLEETNSRIVTQTFDGLEPLTYSTVSRPVLELDTTERLTIPSFVSVEMGPEGFATHVVESSSMQPTVSVLPEFSKISSEDTPSDMFDTRTFYTTYTLFTTFFSGTDAFISSSEQVVSNVVTVLATDITTTSSSTTYDGPITVFDTSEHVTTKTKYNTVTFYATLFSDTGSFVTPIEEVETQTEVVTEIVTISKTILPTSSATISISSPSYSTSEYIEPSVVLTHTLYSTFTNFVTLFQGTDTVVTNLEETVSNVVTITVPASEASSFMTSSTQTLQSIAPTSTSEYPMYTTKEVLSTQTHYVTLFNGDEHILSSIEEVVTKTLTELADVKSSTVLVETLSSEDIVSVFTPTLSSSFSTPSFTSPTETTTSTISTYQQELVPSIRTLYSTLTFYTTYFSGTSSIIASQEEVLTSYVTLFVPSSLIKSKSTESSSVTPTSTLVPTTVIEPSVFVFTTTDYSTLTLYTTLFSGDETVVISSEHIVPEVITATITPTTTSSSTSQSAEASVLTFLTTFTYYTTYFSDTEPVIASSESVVTQYITIDSAPTHTISTISHTEISFSKPVDETIIGIATVSGGDISSSLKEDSESELIIGVSSVVATEIETKSTADVETHVQILTNIEKQIDASSEIMSSKIDPITEVPILFSPTASYVTSSDVSDLKTADLDSSFSVTSASIKEGSTVIFFSDVVLPTIRTPDLPATSSSIISDTTEIIGQDGKITTLTPSATLIVITGVDGFITKFPEPDITSTLSAINETNVDVASSITSAVKPATVIELSDLLGGNTAFGGDIGLAIQDIVSLITGKKNKTDSEVPIETTTIEDATEINQGDKSTTESIADDESILKSTTEGTKMAEKVYTEETTTESSVETVEDKIESNLYVTLPTESEEGPKDVDYPVFVLPSASVYNKSETEYPSPVYVPHKEQESPIVEFKMPLGKDTPLVEYKITTETDSTHTTTLTEKVSTSVITGARTVFILPTDIGPPKSETSSSSSLQPTFKIDLSTTKILFESRETPIESITSETPTLSKNIATKVVSGIETVFFSSTSKDMESPWRRPDGPNRPLQSEKEPQEETVVGRANIPTLQPSSKPYTTITKDGRTILSRTTSGATTIFFPGQIPKMTAPSVSTRYVTSVETITRTLALTTTRTYYTRDSTLTVPSVYTTTIPPRTFVSTIIGKRTILGILPEPSETVQIYKNTKPSERTTTVTTTTLIFNSIPSTVVRTLVLPTSSVSQSSDDYTGSSAISSDGNVFNAGTEKPAEPPESADSTSVSSNQQPKGAIDPNSDTQLKQKSRDETYLRAADPRIREFQPNVELHKNQGKGPVIVITPVPVRPEEDPFLNGRNGVCDPKCQPFKKEVCSEKEGFWKCRCRPGHARRNDHEICKEINTFVVLLKVMKMGNTTVNYDNAMMDPKSKEYQDFSEALKEGISEVYHYTNVRDHFLGAEINDVVSASSETSESYLTTTTKPIDSNNGIIVNFTVQVTKSISSELLEQELTRSLLLSERRFADSFLLATPLTQSVRDFDECSDFRYNDCSLRATCENLEGTYTCKCDEKFEDKDSKLPGRTCLAKTVNCEYCHKRGDCLESGDDQIFCRCLPMYVGKRCEINGLVLAVALPTAVAVVVILLTVVLCCCRKCRRKGPKGASGGGDPSTGMFKGIALKGPVGGTLDRKAMIDTSSESSGEHVRRSYPFDTYQESGDVTPIKDSKRSDLSLNRSLSTGYVVPPVMIPRAKSQAGGSSNNGKPVNYTVYNGQVYVW